MTNVTICWEYSANKVQIFLSPSGSDNPGLEVVLLLTADTDGVTEVVEALGAAQLVSPGPHEMMLGAALSPGLWLSMAGSAAECWVLIEVLQVRVATVDHQLLKNCQTLSSL